jgi:hypothetical protein
MSYIFNMWIYIGMILLDNLLRCLLFIVVTDPSRTYDSTVTLICNAFVMFMISYFIKIKLKVLIYPTRGLALSTFGGNGRSSTGGSGTTGDSRRGGALGGSACTPSGKHNGEMQTVRGRLGEREEWMRWPASDSAWLKTGSMAADLGMVPKWRKRSAKWASCEQRGRAIDGSRTEIKIQDSI